MTDMDTALKLHLYRTVAATGVVPNAPEAADELGAALEEVRMSMRRLADERLLVLDPETTNVLMAPPFSAVATQHLVTVGEREYYANCIWDAFGIVAALGLDADIASRCGDCGESLRFSVRDGTPLPSEAVAQYAVPAAHWWEDIVFT